MRCVLSRCAVCVACCVLFVEYVRGLLRFVVVRYGVSFVVLCVV